MTPNLDLYPRNQDWTKQTPDFPEWEGDPEGFRDHIEQTVGIENFKRLPVYTLNPDHPLFSELAGDE